MVSNKEDNEVSETERRKSGGGKQQTISSLFQKSAKRKKNDDVDKNEKKKQKTESIISDEKENISSSDNKMDVDEEKPSKKTGTGKVTKKAVERCGECRQVLDRDDLKLFQGDSDEAVEEFLMLCDPRLSLLSGEEQNHDNYDDRPQHKITQFSVYDKNTHLCPFDTGLIDKNILLYFSGVVKPIYAEDPGPEGGVPTKLMGPINEWWISGFDGGENALIGFGTAFAEYILMSPSDDYAPFMTAVAEKIQMSKIVIEFTINNQDARYEDLLNKMETTVPPENCVKFTEDSLLRHAQFLVDQVQSYDSAGSDDLDDVPPLITAPCIRDLIKLAGVTLGQRRELRGVKPKSKRDPKEKKTLGPTKATTTPLVENVFNIFFKDQIDAKGSGDRKRRCGVCEVCQQGDCGKCRTCKDMVKFGGTGKSKQCCINRRCPNLAVKEAEEEAGDTEDENDDGGLTSPMMSPSKVDTSPKLSRRGKESKAKQVKIKWDGESHFEKKNRKYYRAAVFNGEKIEVGSYVKVSPDNPTDPLYICRIRYMWEDEPSSKKMFHAQWLYRSSETVLGESGDPAEVLLCDDCDNNPLGSIVSKCKMKYKKPSADWFTEGGLVDGGDIGTSDDDQDEIFFQKWYDAEEGRFLDPPEEFVREDFDGKYCPCCEREKSKLKFLTPEPVDPIEDMDEKSKTFYNKIQWKGAELRLGDALFIMPAAYTFEAKPREKKPVKAKSHDDEEIYPEAYRRTNTYVKGSNVFVAEPYRVGRILSIYQKKGTYGDAKELMIRVRKLYRPENTHKGFTGTHNADLNMLYWSTEEVNVSFDQVVEKCFVHFEEDPNKDMSKFIEAGPNRFYFKEAYDASSEQYEDAPTEALNEFQAGKSSGKGSGKGKGKGKGKSSSTSSEDTTTVTKTTEPFPKYEPTAKLKGLDIFAGCGGLSEGFHQVGLADSKWAVEFEPAAAQAFRLNNPKTIVFNDDCNHILSMVMRGESVDGNGQRLPQKGDVDLLCGGPPCQGFSGMNRFNSREYSMFKNSLVASYLSYCDYFRPRFFILENVRNFVSFKKGMVLRLALRCLLKMGYQCEFGVLQAGSYGVAQTRRRAIIIAAAPGEVLPNYPEPLHVFAPKALQLSVGIDDKKYQAVKCLESAPLRTTTIRDALHDLPCIKNGASTAEISYDNEPQSHFQKKMRGMDQHVLRDHVCKDMNPLVEARMRHIPCTPGSDWRDLPNQVVRLRDGAQSKKLVYTHDDVKQGAGRGVCSCAEQAGVKCDPADRQFGTLIPWCLPHTSNRHNHWAGLYGRLEWDGFFSTTVTNPEPMGKQGRVLHPEQHRVVSVRECARSQGFPDSFRFYGGILDKHRQIGNAVPPPMAAAIGREIQKSILLKKERKPIEDVGDASGDVVADVKEEETKENVQSEIEQKHSRDLEEVAGSSSSSS